MKVVMYMATSIDGFIAKKDHDTPWSDDEFESYSAKVKEVGNMVIGKTTYDLMLEEENFFEDVGNPFVIVLTSAQQIETENAISVHTLEEAISLLEEKHFEIALLSGGSKTNSSALRSGLIEEIFIDMEPVIFGEGIPLFQSLDASVQLELIDSKDIGNSGIQLHYKVLK